MKILMLMMVMSLIFISDARANDSFYQLPDVQFQDQDGHQFRLAALAGKAWLFGMFYSSCTDVCPYEIEQVHQFEQAVQQDHHGALPAILISMDPDDGLQTLREMASMHHLSGTSLRLVRVTHGDLGMLEGVLGVHVRALGKHAFAHQPVLTQVDATGQIVVQVQASLLQQPEIRARLLNP